MQERVFKLRLLCNIAHMSPCYWNGKGGQSLFIR